MSKYKGTSGTDQEIIRTIGYITDNKFIASYYGVDVRRVTALRHKVNNHKEKVEAVKQVKQSENGRPLAASSGLNSDAERKWNADAKEGSAQLRDALLDFFEKRRLGQSK